MTTGCQNNPCGTELILAVLQTVGPRCECTAEEDEGREAFGMPVGAERVWNRYEKRRWKTRSTSTSL